MFFVIPTQEGSSVGVKNILPTEVPSCVGMTNSVSNKSLNCFQYNF